MYNTLKCNVLKCLYVKLSTIHILILKNTVEFRFSEKFFSTNTIFLLVEEPVKYKEDLCN